jgi:hypothetical protein
MTHNKIIIQNIYKSKQHQTQQQQKMSYYATLARKGELTEEQVKSASKATLEGMEDGKTVLFWASVICGVKIVEPILAKGVNINGLSQVSSAEIKCK